MKVIIAALFIFTSNQLLYFIANKTLFLDLKMTAWEFLVCAVVFGCCWGVAKNLKKSIGLYALLYGIFIGLTCLKSYFQIEFLNLEDITVIPELIMSATVGQISAGLGVVLIVGILFYWLVEWKEKRRSLVLVVLLTVFLNVLFKLFLIETIFNLGTIPIWSSRAASEKLGPLAYFWIQTLNFQVYSKSPSPSEIDAAKYLIQNELTTSSSDQKPSKPNVYVVLVESFWDPQLLLDQLKLKSPFASDFIELHKKNGRKYAIVPQIAGGTPRSEFEILCGLPNTNWNILFKYRMNDGVDCLPTVLSKIGYETFAFHSGYSGMWNRNYTYPKIGIKNYFSGSQLGDYLLKRQSHLLQSRIDPDDIFLGSAFEFIKDQNLKTKNNFYYMLTAGLHFPFVGSKQHTNLKYVAIKNTQLEHYLTQAHSTSLAIGHFINAVKAIDPIGIIVVTGDHLPHTIETIQAELKVPPVDPLLEGKSRDITLDQFRTPLVTVNLPMPKEQFINLPYLTSRIYRQLGLPRYSSISDFYQKPSYGLYVYNRTFDQDSEIVDICNPADEKCDHYFKIKKAFRVIIDDALFGKQLIQFQIAN